MIYLIDDKKPRQELFGWDEPRFDFYRPILKTVYSYNQIKNENLNSEVKIFSKDSIILFHESFFDNVDYSNKKDSLEIRNKLIAWCNTNNIPIVQFSGSINTRKIVDHNVSLPVEILYQNLEIFFKSILNDDPIEKSLKHLLFGDNFKIERILQLKKEIWETKFKLSPLLNQKINEFNLLTNRNIDLKVTQDPTVLKSLINE